MYIIVFSKNISINFEANSLEYESFCGDTGYWFGAVDQAQNGTFQWLDGQPFAYTNWNSSKLSRKYANENIFLSDEPNPAYYHGTMMQESGRWKTDPCAVENCFVCEAFTAASTTPYTGPSTTSTITTTTTSTPTTSSVMTDCYDWRFVGGATTDGIYRIDPGHGLEPFDVYCDMTTEDGGWTTIQKFASRHFPNLLDTISDESIIV